MMVAPRKCYIAAVLLALFAGMAGIAAFTADPGQDVITQTAAGAIRSDISTVLSAADSGAFTPAARGRVIRFPQDHGAHPDFRIEWWYFTGNLFAQDGRRFGYQVTLFRLATALSPPVLDADFAGNQLWMGHLALSDVAAGRFYSDERFTRQSPALAGTEVSPFRLWLEHWQIDGEADALCKGCMRFSITTRAENFALNLQLAPERPLVLHGDNGFSLKASDQSASHYYSMTRLRTSGVIERAGERIAVSGSSWLDREWSTSNLGRDQAGWDWFALQLDSGDDIMVYRLRDQAGGTSRVYAVRVTGDGRQSRLTDQPQRFTVRRRWTTADKSATYPVSWQLRLGELDLRVDAVMDEQLHNGRFRYWEGAVDVTGTDRGADISGLGFVELTGYAN